MKVLSFLSVVTCLVFASNFVSAGPKDKQMSLNFYGQSLNSIDGNIVTQEKLNVSTGTGRRTLTGHRYSEGWLYLDQCFIGGEIGNKIKSFNAEGHQTVTFKNGSTITMRLMEHIVCSVEQIDGLFYGTSDEEWTVLSGTGDFEGASGSMNASSTFQQLWSAPRSSSSSFEGVANYDLD
jgi:hypothetical protein